MHALKFCKQETQELLLLRRGLHLAQLLGIFLHPVHGLALEGEHGIIHHSMNEAKKANILPRMTPLEACWLQDQLSAWTVDRTWNAKLQMIAQVCDG